MPAAITTRDVTVPSSLGAMTFHLHESGAPGSPAIVWLHGSGPGANAISNWERQLGEFGDRFHNIAPDIVGFGNSTHPDPPPQGVAAFTEFRVETLAHLLDELGLDRVTLVGNSMGGIVSLSFVLAHPDRVERLVLMGAGGAPVPLTEELFKLILFYEDASEDAMTDLLTCFVHDPTSLGADLRSIAAQRLPNALRPEVERSHRATFAPGDPPDFSAERIATITQPTLLVHGESDRLIPIASSEYYAAHLPNARFERYPATGHWLMIEQPERFAADVRAFLRERP